jgi:hypothetical protein
MTDVWQHTSHLQADQLKLGNNIGDAVFNYGIAIGEGGLGAKLGERYLAQTRFGSFLQGFTETTVDGKLLNDPIVSQPVENKPVESQPTKPSPLIDAIRQAKAGGDETLIARSAATPAATPIEQGFTGSVRLRTFSDGSQVAFDNNHVLVSTKNGAHMWFKNKQSFLGLRDQLDLKRVVQPSAEGGTGQTSADVFLKKGRLGSDLGSGTTNFFSPEGQTYVFSDGLKLSTDITQRVTEVETPFAKIFSPQRGSWRYNLSADMPSPVVPTAGTIGAVSAPKPIEVNLTNFTSSGRPYKKGLEGALGQMMLERAGDIGTSVFEHYVLIRGDDK